MALSNLLRILGLSSFLGGLMISIVQPWFYIDPGSFSASYIDYMGYILILLGIIGLYLAQYNEIKSFGLLIFVFVLISHSMWLGYKWFLTFVNADLIRSAPEIVPGDLPATNYGADLSLYGLMICLTLFALLSLWKGKVSRIGSSMLFLGTSGALVEMIAEIIPYQLLIPHGVIGLSFAWLGWSLFYGKDRSTINATPIIIDNEIVSEEVASMDTEDTENDREIDEEMTKDVENNIVSNLDEENENDISNEAIIDTEQNDHLSNVQKGEKLGSY